MFFAVGAADMGKIRRIDFYHDEWLTGTNELLNAERGLYITACSLIYSNGGSITRAQLRAACRDHGHAFNRQLGRLIELGKLEVNGEQITNKRCANELQKADKRIANAQQNGSKSSGRPRKNNELENQPGFFSEKLTTNHQPPTTNQESIGSNEPMGADAPRAPLAVVAGIEHTPPQPDPKKRLYTLGREVLGPSAGGLVTKLLTLHGDIAATIYTLEQAKAAAFPKEYVGRILSREVDAPTDWDNHPAYRGIL